MAEPLLQVKNLSVSFQQDTVVDAIDFDIYGGETFALVGESGSGKSITALSVLRLLPNNANIQADNIALNGQNLLTIPEIEFCRWRGRRIGLIFQDPMSSLKPVQTLRSQIFEAIKLNNPTFFTASRSDLTAKTVRLPEEVGIPEPIARLCA